MLKSVAQSNYPQTDGSFETTLWSIVYEPGLCRAEFYFSEQYDRGCKMQLGKKLGFLVQFIE